VIRATKLNLVLPPLHRFRCSAASFGWRWGTLGQQQSSSTRIRIDQGDVDEEPMRVLGESAVADFRKAKGARDH
jgi:hypothetical protein